MQVNADLHIHSKYSMATSPKMDLPTLASQSVKKGIQLVATGDCLHPKWLYEIKTLKEENGVFKLKAPDSDLKTDANFILTTEIEDINQVHHLLIIPSISKAEELYEFIKPHSKDIDSNGRPNVRLDGKEIADTAMSAGALIGPAHAFTPWTAMYAYHNSLKECYGDMAIIREKGRKPVLNVGMPPEEGKYNESACIRCFRHYTIRESVMKSCSCACGGTIKKGVKDRINELASFDEPQYPDHRPPYIHIIPLSEIIAKALGIGPNTKGVKGVWNALIGQYGSEVAVLIDADIKNSGVDERVIGAIIAFKEGKVKVKPGGGGQYGSVELPGKTNKKKIEPQRSLGDFG